MSTPHSFATVEITPSQMLSLNTQPVLLVPGSPGYLFNVYSIVARYVHGTTPYNPVANSDVILAYTGNGTAIGSLLLYPGSPPFAAGIVDQSVDRSFYLWGWFGVNPSQSLGSEIASAPAADIVGSGLYLTQFATPDETYTQFPSGTNWTHGNGTLIVRVEYSYLLA